MNAAPRSARWLSAGNWSIGSSHITSTPGGCRGRRHRTINRLGSARSGIHSGLLRRPGGNRPFLPLSEHWNRQGSKNGSLRDHRPTPTSTPGGIGDDQTGGSKAIERNQSRPSSSILHPRSRGGIDLACDAEPEKKTRHPITTLKDRGRRQPRKTIEEVCPQGFLEELQESGVRSQESGVRSQESGVRSQESGVRSQESGVRSQESGVRSQESGVRSQESGVNFLARYSLQAFTVGIRCEYRISGSFLPLLRYHYHSKPSHSLRIL